MHAATKPVTQVGVLIATVALSSLGVLRVDAEETIVDSTHGFTLTIPDGFVPRADLAQARPDIAHAFALGDPTDDELDIFLFIQLMGGEIGRERLNPAHKSPEFQGRLFTTKWQQFDVDAVEIPERLGEIEAINYNVQIPIRRQAIQVRLFGPSSREAELKQLLAATLAGLQGESNWTTSGGVLIPFRESPSYGTILLGVAIVFILAGLIVLFVVSRIAPKGAVLVIAAAIYVSSFFLDDIRIREVVMLTGAMRLFGIVGGILGIIDLVRKRKPINRAEPGPPQFDQSRPQQ